MLELQNLLDPRPWPEGSYELKSVHPFVCHSFWQFYWNWLITVVFLKICMVLGAHMEICVTEPGFLRKLLPAKMTECSKMAQKLVFWTF